MRRSISMGTEAAPTGGVAGAEAGRKADVSSMRQADEPVSDADAEDILTLLGDEECTVLRCISCPCALVTMKAYRAPVACNYCFAALWWGKQAVFPPYSITCTRGGKEYRHE